MLKSSFFSVMNDNLMYFVAFLTLEVTTEVCVPRMEHILSQTPKDILSLPTDEASYQLTGIYASYIHMRVGI